LTLKADFKTATSAFKDDQQKRHKVFSDLKSNMKQANKKTISVLQDDLKNVVSQFKAEQQMQKDKFQGIATHLQTLTNETEASQKKRTKEFDGWKV
jgi:hypothetical protein